MWGDETWLVAVVCGIHGGVTTLWLVTVVYMVVWPLSGWLLWYTWWCDHSLVGYCGIHGGVTTLWMVTVVYMVVWPLSGWLLWYTWWCNHSLVGYCGIHGGVTTLWLAGWLVAGRDNSISSINCLIVPSLVITLFRVRPRITTFFFPQATVGMY